MPWFVIKKGGPRPYRVIKRSTGEQVGSSKTKADADAMIRAMYAAEGKKKKT